ncbi:NADP-dependent oxidoreductase [Pelagibaculum spongiae]|uniref:NADP-dependent oxidoreductase n=1 Tax=Pelagibaculum spongiae TaxID=2080658 RepID=A0A2V1H5M4_9GAMM|nr:NADP-dependent oxidoreductase [Pelagibaculum spongiae]PVZ72065.1 NADP-dependent oxidoreductase [Pelagibaculum spongiae]
MSNTMQNTTQSGDQNRQWVLASRPQGAPTADNFRLEVSAMPAVNDGQVLLRSVYLSLDPYMRGRMNDAKSYAEPVALGEVMVGASVCRVVESKNSAYSVGDLVLSFGGWQDYHVSDGIGLMALPADMARPSYALGVLGMPGLTAYMGLLDIGDPQPGETVVVAAASGAVGSLVGQIAKLKGCKVIGIAGGDEKCRYVRDTLGFDACIDHKAADLASQLASACGEGIDVYFENVGGKVFDAVLPLLNPKARIPLCGLISQYNASELPAGPDRLGLLMGNLLVKKIKMQGFIVFDDYGHRYNEFMQAMVAWLQQGKIQFREDIVDGLEKSPEAFIGLLEGKNFGKLVVQVGAE